MDNLKLKDKFCLHAFTYLKTNLMGKTQRNRKQIFFNADINSFGRHVSFDRASTVIGCIQARSNGAVEGGGLLTPNLSLFVAETNFLKFTY